MMEMDKLEKSTKKIKSSTKEEKQKYIICNLKKANQKKIKTFFQKYIRISSIF